MDTNYKLTYHYKQQNKIELAMTDLALLLFLYDQSLLSQQQLFRYYTLISDFKSDSSFRRKMSKWHQAGLIRKVKKNIVNGYQLALLNITEAGLELLKTLGLLPQHINRKYISKVNIDHTLAIKEAFIDFISIALIYEPFYVSGRGNICIPIHSDFHMYYEFEGEDSYYKQEGLLNKSFEYVEFTSLIGQIELKVDNLEQQLYEKVKPDLALTYLGRKVFLEIDIGTEMIGNIHSENSNTIVGKIKRYDELGIEDATVLFLVLDNEQSLKTIKAYPNRVQRIRNMKSAIANTVIVNEMQIFVLPFSRGAFRFYAFKQMYNFDVIVSSNELVRHAIIHRILSNVLTDSWAKTLEKSSNLKTADTMLYSEETREHIIVLFLEEGSCNHFDKIEGYLYKMMKGMIASNAYLLLIYSKPEEMYKDVILSREALNNSYYRSRIIKTNLDDLQNKNVTLFNIKNEDVYL